MPLRAARKGFVLGFIRGFRGGHTEGQVTRQTGGTLEREQQRGERDSNAGCVLLAILYLAIGAAVLRESGEP